MRFPLMLFTSLCLTACGVDSEFTFFSSHTAQPVIPKIIAHRGHRSAAPENTLAAFQKALDAQSDLVELDYYHTKDEHPVVIHDATLDRTTNATAVWGRRKVRVDSLQSESLKALDAGTWFDARFSGEKVPTLEEALDLIQGQNGKTLIEQKAGDAEACLRILKQKDYTQQVVVQSFNWSYLADIKSIDASVETAALGRDEITPKVIAELVSLGVKTASWNYTNLNKETVAALHQAGLDVYAFVVDRKDDLLRMRAAGVDGVITDDPTFARDVFRHY